MSDSSKNKPINFTRKRKVLSANEYVKGILDGNRATISRAITLIESTRPQDQKIAQQIIEKCLPHSGKSIRIGITGVPGVGKSTFIEAFGSYLTDRGSQLAVLAIDPSSQRSKGSILGDKTRMEKLAADNNAFIRPSPSAGSLGGVARATRETIIICEAAGFDTIIVETVGVGQSETAVYSMVDFFLLLMLAGAGDELQGIKRGIMEMADAIAINKADGDNLSKAQKARKEYQNALHLFPPSESGWTPRVETCSAITSDNIDKMWKIISDYKEKAQASGFFVKKRQEQARFWLHESIEQLLKSGFFNNKKVQKELSGYEQQVIEGRTSPYNAALKLLELYQAHR